MVLFEKFGQHQPLNRQAERYAKEGVEISLSTLADQVGACAVALQPIHDLIRAHTGARTLQYVYDFGDDWDHSIRIERVSEASPGVTYPRLLKASGACPPEDVGGAPGYEAFLEALADPDHEQHDDMVSWSGASFDPKDARIDRIVERFDQLAKKWSPRPGKPKAPKPTP